MHTSMVRDREPTGGGTFEERLIHSLQLMRAELAASRGALITQKIHFQRQLDLQSEQIRIMQQTLQVLATRFSENVYNEHSPYTFTPRDDEVR